MLTSIRLVLADTVTSFYLVLIQAGIHWIKPAEFVVTNSFAELFHPKVSL